MLSAVWNLFVAGFDMFIFFFASEASTFAFSAGAACFFIVSAGMLLGFYFRPLKQGFWWRLLGYVVKLPVFIVGVLVAGYGGAIALIAVKLGWQIWITFARELFRIP